MNSLSDPGKLRMKSICSLLLYRPWNRYDMNCVSIPIELYFHVKSFRIVQSSIILYSKISLSSLDCKSKQKQGC